MAKDCAYVLSRLCSFWKASILVNREMKEGVHEFITRPLDLFTSTNIPNFTMKVYQLGPRLLSNRRAKNWITEINVVQMQKRYKTFTRIFEDALIKGDVEKSFHQLTNSWSDFEGDEQAKIFIQILERLRVSEKGTYLRMHVDSLYEKIQ